MLLKIQATLIRLQGDTPEQAPVTSLVSIACTRGEDCDSPHDTEPALTPGREVDLQYPEEPSFALSEHEEYWDPTIAASDGKSKGMLDFLPIGLCLSCLLLFEVPLNLCL